MSVMEDDVRTKGGVIYVGSPGRNHGRTNGS